MSGIAKRMQLAASNAGFVSTPWALSNARQTGNTLDVFSELGENAATLCVGDSGSKLYVSGFGNIYQYNLSTAWDLSTASYSSKSFDPSGLVSFVGSFVFKPDGTEFFVSDFISSPTEVSKFSLSTAWDISTASSVSNETIVNEARGIDFKSDGTKMFVTDSDVYQHTLSTAWDTTTESYDSISLSSNSGKRVSGVRFADSGSRLLLTLLNTSSPYVSIEGFTLSTAYDLSTATFDDSLTETTDIRAAEYKPDGTRFFAQESGSSVILEYEM